MESSTGKTNFVKLYMSVIKYGTKTQRELIKHQLTRSNLTFGKLLNENSHEIYHLCYMNRCCRCGSIDRLPSNTIINRNQYSKLFQQNDTARLNGHDHTKSDSTSCNYAHTSASVDDLDLSLSSIILLHCCQELLWNCCLSSKGKTLEDFLNENKHAIYHMWIHDKSCRLCKHGIKPTVQGSIRESDWYQLFKRSTIGDDPSCFVAIQGITAITFDKNLAYKILQELSEEVKNIRGLREIRNYFSHIESPTINLDKFEQMWTEIERILLQLSTTYGGDVDVKEQLHSLKTEGSPKEDVKLLLANIQREIVSHVIKNTYFKINRFTFLLTNETCFF